MKMILITIAIVICMIGLILIYATTKPDTLSIRRSVLIRTAPATVFGLINDLHSWPKWAPQDREDKTMVRTYGTAAAGVGASSMWTSNGSAGRGSMKIVHSIPDSDIEIHVDFRSPFVAHNINHFHLQPFEGGTLVTWSMQGTNVYMMKVMSVFVNPDRMMGLHFEAGLANLKSAAENLPTGRAKT